MKTSRSLFLGLAIVCAHFPVQALGFTNLNFESANVSGYSPGYVPTNAAFPGWALYYGTSNNPTYISAPAYYDGASLGGALVVLVDSNAPSGGAPLPIQGNYSAFLEGSSPAAALSASIGQTGTIPISAQSLTFFGSLSGTLQVSFDSQALSFVAISNALNYTVYSADISPFAGQTGQLLFTAPIQSSDLLDNIQFSSIPVPEPSELALTTLVALLFGLRRWRNRQGQQLSRRDDICERSTLASFPTSVSGRHH